MTLARSQHAVFDDPSGVHPLDRVADASQLLAQRRWAEETGLLDLDAVVDTIENVAEKLVLHAGASATGRRPIHEDLLEDVQRTSLVKDLEALVDSATDALVELARGPQEPLERLGLRTPASGGPPLPWLLAHAADLERRYSPYQGPEGRIWGAVVDKVWKPTERVKVALDAPKPDPAPPPAPAIQGAAEKRPELEQLKLSQLRKRALAGHVDEAEIETAEDSDDPRGALIALILSKSAAEASKPGPAPRPRSPTPAVDAEEARRTLDEAKNQVKAALGKPKRGPGRPHAQPSRRDMGDAGGGVGL